MWVIGSIESWAMFGLGVSLLILILLRRSAKYYKRLSASSGGGPTPSTRPRRQEKLLDAPPELLHWQVEMHDIARDLKGELDSKMVALQTLTRLAREEAERLEAAIEAARTLNQAENHEAK